MRVLGVHGVRSHQAGLTPQAAAERLAGWWLPAAREGLGLPDDGMLTLDVAYYAHHLHSGTAQGEEDPDLLDTATQQLIVNWARLLGADEATAQGWLTAPACDAISWVARRHGLDDRFIRLFATVLFREVQRYFTDQAARDAARSQVAAAICRTRPKVIIAHSLGSVVTYEALWADDHPPVDLLLTLGSPLAMPGIIYDRLAPHVGARARPPGVTTWINVADRGDIIAIPCGGIPVCFTGVKEDHDNIIGVFSYHQVTKYLANTTVGEILARHL